MCVCVCVCVCVCSKERAFKKKRKCKQKRKFFQHWQIKFTYVVYFDQLLDAARTQKLIKTNNFDISRHFASFQMFLNFLSFLSEKEKDAKKGIG